MSRLKLTRFLRFPEVTSLSDLDWLTQRPVAHRGLHDASAGVIENTPSAVQAAVSYGFAVEVDLQVSKDGEAMVFHDATLDRLTTSRGKVIDRTVKQLKRVNFKDTKDKMWTLSDLLQLVRGVVPLVIEIKSPRDNVGPLESRVAKILSTYNGHACVMSFNPHSIIAIKSLTPALVRGLVAERFDDIPEWAHLSNKERFKRRHLLYGFEADVDFIAYHVKALPAPAPWLARTLLRKPLLSWTVRSEQDRRTVKRWADQMIFEGFVPDNPALREI